MLVSDVHKGFEAVKVLNAAGSDVIVVPFPVLLAVTDIEGVAEA